jgi:hypothetical protein
LVPLAKHGGRKRTIDERGLKEIFYVLWTGCRWRALPKDLRRGAQCGPAWRSCRSRSAAAVCAAISPHLAPGSSRHCAGKSIALFGVFGPTLAIGSLPEAVTWLLYSFAPSRHSVEPDGRAWSQNEAQPPLDPFSRRTIK